MCGQTSCCMRQGIGQFNYNVFSFENPLTCSLLWVSIESFEWFRVNLGQSSFCLKKNHFKKLCLEWLFLLQLFNAAVMTTHTADMDCIAGSMQRGVGVTTLTSALYLTHSWRDIGSLYVEWGREIWWWRILCLCWATPERERGGLLMISGWLVWFMKETISPPLFHSFTVCVLCGHEHLEFIHFYYLKNLKQEKMA